MQWSHYQRGMDIQAGTGPAVGESRGPSVSTPPGETVQGPSVSTPPGETVQGPSVSTPPGETVRGPSVSTPPGETVQGPSVSTPPGETVQGPSVSTPPGETVQGPSVSTPPGETVRGPSVSTPPGETVQGPSVSTPPGETVQGPSVSTPPGETVRVPSVSVMGGGRRRAGTLLLLLLLLMLLMLPAAKGSRDPQCPTTCSCTSDSALCIASRSIPQVFAGDLISLTFVKAKFRQIPERAFSHIPTLQFLLFNSNTFTVIGDDAFNGLSHLQYLFIENNDVQALSKHTFRGLTSLNHLSLGNNNLHTLPRDLFANLQVLTHLDLRGNTFHCDCKMKWLVEWLLRTNTSVPPSYCVSPTKYQGQSITNLPLHQFDCITTEFTIHQTLPFQSISAESFLYADDLYITFAQVNNGNCTFLMWDHVEMVFRKFENISAVHCKPLVIEDKLYVIVAQLFHGSHIYQWDDYGGKFIKIQDIDGSKIRKPNDVETFRMEGDWYFIVADSSKAGASTVYKWNKGGFYTHHSLHAWHRDTDVEYVEMDNKHRLVVCSSTQGPVVYQWNKGLRQFSPQAQIPNMLDVHAVRHFKLKKAVYLCLARYIGDSTVVRWEHQRFTELQALPSRGTMVLQPFSVAHWHYLLLGCDFSFSHVYQWDQDKLTFAKVHEWSVRAPRAFQLVHTDDMNLVLAASFKGNTVVYRHRVVDTSA
ncbi:leucine-rich repeat LGI family member 3-like isoform X2 [Rhinoraja longicauda]